jgi:hypothetical protein
VELVVQPVNINANVNTIPRERVVISANLAINNMHGVQEQVKAHSNVEDVIVTVILTIVTMMQKLPVTEKVWIYSVDMMVVVYAEVANITRLVIIVRNVNQLTTVSRGKR